MTLAIGGVAIGGDNPCRFIAEASNNHGGDPDRMRRIIRAAKDAGADFLKTQCYDADELVALRGDGPAPAQWGEAGWSMRDLYTKAATPMEWFDWIPSYCADVGIVWFSSVFGERSLAVLERVGCPAYKVARLDNKSQDLRAALGRGMGMRPLIVSESRHYESWPRGDTALRLYCPVGYPQTQFALRGQFHDGVTRAGDYYRDHFDGFSYHGTDIRVPVAAAALGAKLIECHVMLEAEPSELEANISLTERQLASMISDVRAVEAMLA